MMSLVSLLKIDLMILDIFLDDKMCLNMIVQVNLKGSVETPTVLAIDQTILNYGNLCLN